MTPIFFLLVLYGLYLSIEAMRLTAQAEAWKATMKMAILMIILTLCAGYIYLTRTNTILLIN